MTATPIADKQKLEIEELNRISPEAYEQSSKLPLVVVLDNVRSLHNIGSVFRTADAFRIERLYLCGITATPPQAEIHKTALGAEHTVKWEYAESTLEVVHRLAARGYAVYAVEQTRNSTLLNRFSPAPHTPCAVVLGNEVKGVQQQVVDACVGSLEIPQYGTKHSLNVSVAAGIVLWHLADRMGIASVEP